MQALPAAVNIQKIKDDQSFVGSALLGTIQMRVLLSSGRLSKPVRGFCDQGSQVNLITEHTVQSLGLKRIKASIPISGINGTASATGYVNVSFYHRHKQQFVCNAKLLVVRVITRRLPDRHFAIPFAGRLEQEDLADDCFNIPGGIDILVGAGMWAGMVSARIVKTGANEAAMLAQDTAFGWVISGHLASCNHFRLLCCHIVEHSEDAELDKILLSFWKHDDLPKERLWTPDEQRAEDIFNETHSRDENGRYVVRIPMKKDCPTLGNSESIAKARFMGIEGKFSKNPELFKLYKAVFDDYRAKRQMVLAPELHAAQMMKSLWHVSMSKCRNCLVPLVLSLTNRQPIIHDLQHSSNNPRIRQLSCQWSRQCLVCVGRLMTICSVLNPTQPRLTMMKIG